MERTRSNSLPTAATSYDNAFITRFEAALHGFLPLFFALDCAQQNIVEVRRGVATDLSMPAPSSAARNPDSRENLMPRRPVSAKLASATPIGVHAYGNTSPVFSVTTQAGSEGVGASAVRERVRLSCFLTQRRAPRFVNFTHEN